MVLLQLTTTIKLSADFQCFSLPTNACMCDENCTTSWDCRPKVIKESLIKISLFFGILEFLIWIHQSL